MRYFIVALMTILVSMTVAAQESVLEFEGVKAIDISNSTGNIIVSGDDNISKTSVKIKKNKSKEDCNLSVEMSGENLNIEQKAPAASSRQCETDIQVRVPQKNIDLKLVVINSSGDVSVNSYAGDLDVEMESGNLKVNDTIVGDGKISVKRGSAKFEGLQATEMFVKMDDGNIALGFGKILDSGKVEIRNMSGNVDVTIPFSTKVDTSYIVGQGRASGVASEKQSSSAGRYVIELIVPNGNFSVNKR